MDDTAAGFDRLWAELEPVGLSPGTGGYRRFAWSDADLTLREWFAAAAAARGLDVTVDRAGNQWAWWGDPDATPGVVIGSHLDSVPDGGAYDGPLGVVNFTDEEGARFGVACAGSRLLAGALDPDRARALRDADPMLVLAEVIRSARAEAAGRGCLATVGKVSVWPNAVNAIPSAVSAWLEAP